MIRSAVFIVACLALAGCDTAREATDTLARDRAKAAVDAAVASEYPGVDASPITDCVIDNASATEIVTFTANAAVNRMDANVSLLLEVLKRPEAQRCLIQNSLTFFQS